FDPTVYAHGAGAHGLTVISSWSAWGLALAQIPFIINFFWSMRKKERAVENPWHATTLEWSTPTPPPHGNFPVPPVVYRGPYEYRPRGVQAGLSVPIGTFNTLVLITSSVTMVMAWASLKMNQFAAFKRYFGATIGLGSTFLVVKAFEYGTKFHHGIFPWVGWPQPTDPSTFNALYFTLTGMPGLHVL